jgi:hypothetical protein
MLALLAFFLGLELGRSESHSYSLPPMKGSDFTAMIAYGLLCGLSVATAFALVWHQDVMTPYLFGQHLEVGYRTMNIEMRSMVSALLNNYTIGAVSTTLGFTFFSCVSKKTTVIVTTLAVVGSFLYLCFAPHSTIGGLMFGISIFGTLSLIITLIHAIHEARHSQ